MNSGKAAVHSMSGTTFKVGHNEFVYEKLIDVYVRPWFQGKSPGFTQHVYVKAMDELELLKKKKKKVAGKATKTEEEKMEVRNLPDTPPKGKKGKEQNSSAERGGGRVTSKNSEATISMDLINETVYKMAKKDEQIQEMKKKMSKLNEQLFEAKKEIEDLRMRLSQVIGDKMRDNNPDIADLSDPFRPTELGTHFSELYDNEWSDAFEKLPMKDEKSRVNILHHVIKTAFDFCEQKKDEQMSIVAKTLQGVVDDEEAKDVSMPSLKNLLKSTRKKIAANVSKRIAKQFASGSGMMMYLEGFNIETIDKTLEQYAMRCAELCWHMVVSDPPLVISEDDTGEDFRSSVYRPYTRSDKGKSKVEYIVWPALYLHEGGPLVSRGVAQPDKK